MKFCKSTLPSRKYLMDLVPKNNLARVAEVGVYRGWFAKELYSMRKDNLSCLYLIDPWNKPQCEGQMVGGEDEFREVCALFCNQNISIIKEYSQQASSHFSNESLDLVYLDGEHSYDGVVADIHLWYPKVCEGGILAGHDIFAPEHIGVTQAVMDALPSRIIFIIPAETCSYTNNTINPSWYIVKR